MAKKIDFSEPKEPMVPKAPKVKYPKETETEDYILIEYEDGRKKKRMKGPKSK